MNGEDDGEDDGEEDGLSAVGLESVVPVLTVCVCATVPTLGRRQ